MIAAVFLQGHNYVDSLVYYVPAVHKAVWVNLILLDTSSIFLITLNLKSKLSLFDRVNVVLNRTVVVDSD